MHPVTVIRNTRRYFLCFSRLRSTRRVAIANMNSDMNAVATAKGFLRCDELETLYDTYGS
jgi:phage terminase large subunit-like protein